jgi:hypothetical protein
MIKKINPYSSHIIIALALGGLFMLIYLITKIYRVGDGSEYYALFYAWSETFRPWMSDSAYAAYEKFLQIGSVNHGVSAERLKAAFPALDSDFNHFWFYSLLSYLASVPFKAIGVDLNAHSSFMLLHYLLLVTLFSVLYHLYKWQGVAAAFILVLTSPLIWYLNKVHTEFFTVILILLSFAFIQKNNISGVLFFLGLHPPKIFL